MNELSTASAKRRKNAVKKNERLTQDETLKKLLDEHKKKQGEVIWVRIDDRTHIELSANMTEDEKKDRVKNYLKHSNFKPIKRV